jgi:hypothetical protein
MTRIAELLGSEFKLRSEVVAKDFPVFAPARHVEDRIHHP